MTSILGLAKAAALAVAFAAGGSAAGAATIDFEFSNGGGTGGYVDSGASPVVDFSFAIVGNNDGSSDVYTTMTATATGDFAVSGNWTYLTADVDGPSYDTFGYFVGDDYFQLSDDDGNVTQLGTYDFDVAAGDSFGFYLLSTDGDYGAALATVSGSVTVAPVPLPAGGLLLVGALGGLALLRRRGRAA
ncbi:VPLPA-CTERM sorting domain-containing protein [Frigidibacter oleivorans]|uniref:VPLPA-CTERM sorting domain-containing protein n=1 Tax=Frigidibacter oleivorans TaxID=2487129 RepID=UPI000F8EB294|nr:VPLPA-CTERM sorting domain-containing protein [Frigidibacter oleivorans]